MVKWSKRLY